MYGKGLNGIPASYDYINNYNGHIIPSTVHVKNTALERYFFRYLTMKLFSVFEFKLPEEWDLSYFRYCLFLLGYIGVVETDRFGVICQNCGLYGRGINYQPTDMIITNPLLKSTLHPKIGIDCELIKMMPDYGSAYDLLSFYSSMMAICAEAAGVNMLNSKLAYVFAVDDKSDAETLKKMFDQLQSGNPAVFVSKKKLVDDEGNSRIMMLNQNLKQTYIAGDLVADLHRWENRFNTEIGIPNANYEKSERLITDEVNANNTDTKAKALVWLEEMQRGMKKVNAMFGTDLDVKLRFEYQTEGGQPDGSDNAERPAEL